MALDLDADISGLRGADYNPRQIDDAGLERLAESIRTLGLVKPMIVRGDLLVAGHQRAKALRSLGITRAPVYSLPRDTTRYDEVRFNQLHNGTDMDGGDEGCTIADGLPTNGWHVVGAERISGNYRSKLANVRGAISDLIMKYGPWGGVVATKSGKIIHAAQYALAASLTGTPLTVFAIEDADEHRYRTFLDRQYGEFSYAHLPRDTFIQTLAQMVRLRSGPSGKQMKSTLYETMVIPFIASHPAARLIDFGSGQGDYAKRMRAQGHSVHDIELFRRKGSDRAIDVRAVNGMIDKAIADLDQHGPYDATVCDSVLNSVDCPAASDAVMTTVNALTKNGGRAR